MQNMILYQKVYDFMIYFFAIVDRFPKHEKFALQAQIKNSTYKMLRNKKRLLQLSEGLKSGEVSPEEFINSISSILGHSMYSRNYSYRKMLNDYLSENTGGKDVL